MDNATVVLVQVVGVGKPVLVGSDKPTAGGRRVDVYCCCMCARRPVKTVWCVERAICHIAVCVLYLLTIVVVGVQEVERVEQCCQGKGQDAADGCGHFVMGVVSCLVSVVFLEESPVKPSTTGLA